MLVAASGQAVVPSTLRVDRGRRGFTLLEVLVAVGAVAVVAAGLAVVFDSVGKTVSAGRRASRINQVGQLVKQQITTDFASLTRDGFLVIRQSYADVNGDDAFAVGDDRVVMSEAESSLLARPRRVDEILFFQNGSFSSMRSPVIPGGDVERARVAQAGEAMVYYGHGHLWSDAAQEFAYMNAEIDDSVPAGGSYDNRLGGSDGPNAFAGDWVLVRKQVLLTGVPGTDGRDIGDYYDLSGGTLDLLDGDCQVAGLPAASSIYRDLNRIFGPGNPADYDGRGTDYAWFRRGVLQTDSYSQVGISTPGFSASPAISSGTIDLATTSLSELRKVMENFSFVPGDSETSLAVAQANTPIEPGAATLERMRLWMDNAMPTASADPTLLPLLSSREASPQSRLRVAIQPPGILNNFDATNASAGADRRLAMVSRNSRQMIAASALLTNCTEFVVEWSFGKLDASGNVIWHGPPRRGSVVRPYVDTPSTNPQVQFVTTATNDNQLVLSVPVTQQLVYGEPVANVALAVWDRTTLTSTFGFKNPLVDPNLDRPAGTPDPNPSWQDPGDVPGFIDWAWPTQIRVRISITDPLEPTTGNETTFEYIFSIPDAGGLN